jgi:hypothetical protein
MQKTTDCNPANINIIAGLGRKPEEVIGIADAKVFIIKYPKDKANNSDIRKYKL